MYRAPSRRFTTYWAVLGEPGEEAQRLIDHRGAQEIPIQNADSFFPAVQQCVESIEEFSRPHPLSTEAAVASLKRYIPEPRYRIKLSDLVAQTVEKVVELTSEEALSAEGPSEIITEFVTDRVRRYEGACSTLLAMASFGGYWAEEEHYPVWRRALERLGSATSKSGLEDFWFKLQLYPATLFLYALGLGAVEAGQLWFFGRVLGATTRREHQEDVPAVWILPPSCLFSDVFPVGGQVMQVLEGMKNRHAPLNDWLHETLWPYFESIIPDNNRYTLVFDKLEILMALSCAHYRSHNRSIEGYWAPPGAFGYRSENRVRILQEIRDSLSTKQSESPFVTCGIFGETAEDCEKGLAGLEGFISKLNWW